MDAGALDEHAAAMTETATFRELHRSRSHRMLAGVCGGLGRYFDINPVVYRVGFVVLTLLGGAGIIVYCACALVIPDEGERDSLASDVLRNHRKHPFAVVGLALVAVAGIALLSHVSLHFHSEFFWVVVLVLGTILLLSRRRREEPSATATAAAPAIPDTPAATGGRRRSGLVVFIVAVGLLFAAVAAFFAVAAGLYAHIGHGIGDRQYAPPTTNALRSYYRVGVGDLSVDLSRLHFGPGETTVRADVGIGHLRIVVPADVTVRVKSHVNWGDTNLLGHDESGHNVKVDVGNVEPQLVLETHVGIGQAEVDRAVA
jgi:phage shock protein PspC (stress-responsive transcriptional regulator)